MKRGADVADLKWYMKRLSVMSFPEIVHRLGEQVTLRSMQVQQRIGGDRFPLSAYDPNRYAFCTGDRPVLPDLAWDLSGLSSRWDSLSSGTMEVLGSPWRWDGSDSCWHRAPDTRKTWPALFSGAIPYRGGNPYGDIRVSWEPARLQQLVTLSLAARNLGPEIEEQAIDLLEEIFISWVRANPWLKGIHYISAMEAGLRILAVCHALDLVREKLRTPHVIWPALLSVVESHARLIVSRLSLYSSAGNHTIAEAAGLIYAGTLFPEMDGAEQWKRTGCSVLSREAERQILPDGGGIEQSFWYHLFIVDLVGLVVHLFRHWNEPVPKGIEDAWNRGKDFLNTFSDGPKRLPRIGDADHGYALSPDLRISWNEQPRSGGLSRFDRSGYSLVRADASMNADLIFDHGPLGMPPSYGHGHADALSVLFRLDGRDLLIDPGTYTYGGEKEWRSYFRGTRAHNTVAVDGQDQAMEATAFIWSRPFGVRLVRRETFPTGKIRILACHDGYTRLKGEVLHWRGVVYRPPGSWLIWDCLTGRGEHTLELHWHPGVEPEPVEDGFLLPGFSRPVTLSVRGGEITRHQGETGPILGWRSEQYGVREPSPVIRAVHRGPLPYEFITRIEIGGSDNPSPDDDFLKNRDVSSLRAIMIRAQHSQGFSGNPAGGAE